MNAHVSNSDLTYVVPSALSTSGSAAYATPSRRRGIVAWLASLGEWFAEMPRRRAVLSELSALSDHELADIGLARGDLPRVFDPEFAQRRQAA